ncbi:MAG: hypothetical protein LC105_12170 [Chitinophagales bacterium]|nr:hypothetical protein [Chitinophagales bacterium]
MKHYNLTIVSTTILLSLTTIGCQNKVEVIKTEIDKNFEVELMSEIRPVAKTMEFYLYSVPTNYWYPDGTTTREIIDDELKHGYKNLGKLDNLINSIQTDNDEITDAVDTLHNRIIVARKEIRKAQKAMEQVNSIFGLGLYGGMTSLYDFGIMLGGNSNDDDDEAKMPEKVLEAFENLKDVIQSANYQLLTSIHNFEEKSIEGREISSKELLEIRTYIKQKLKDNINLYYTGTDTLDRNEATQRIIDWYDKISQF